MRPTCILVTGKSGFIGRNLVNELHTNFRGVKILYISSITNENENIIKRCGGEIQPNSKQQKLMEEVDCLVLNGSKTPKDKEELLTNFDSNFEFLKNLLSMPFPNLTKVIHASSMDVYDKSTLLISESSETSTSDLYAKSKIVCESYIEKYCKSRAIKFSNVRIGHVYGPGDEKYKKIIPNLYRHFINKEELFLPDDCSKIDLNLIYVNDLIKILVNLIEKEEIPEILNAVNCKSIKLSEVISIFEDTFNKTVNPTALIDTTNSNYNYDGSVIRNWIDTDFQDMRVMIPENRNYYEKNLSH